MIGDSLGQVFWRHFDKLFADNVGNLKIKQFRKGTVTARHNTFEVFKVNRGRQHINQVLDKDFVVCQCARQFLGLATITQHKGNRIAGPGVAMPGKHRLFEPHPH